MQSSLFTTTANEIVQFLLFTLLMYMSVVDSRKNFDLWIHRSKFLFYEYLQKTSYS